MFHLCRQENVLKKKKEDNLLLIDGPGPTQPSKLNFQCTYIHGLISSKPVFEKINRKRPITRY